MQCCGNLRNLLIGLISEVCSDPTSYLYRATTAHSNSNAAHSSTDEKNGSRNSIEESHSTSSGAGFNMATSSTSSSQTENKQNQMEEKFVQERIAQLCHQLVDKLNGVDIKSLPVAVSRIIYCLQKLTIGDSNHDENEQNSEKWIIFDQPDARVFNLSLTALFFLRLICPAMISPVDWGIIHSNEQPLLVKDFLAPTVGKYPFLEERPWYRFNDYPGCPTAAMLILAHTLSDHFNDSGTATYSSTSVATDINDDQPSLLIEKIGEMTQGRELLAASQEIAGNLNFQKVK